MFWLYLILSVLVGILLGLFYFGGLWLTVQKITAITYPYLLVLLSFIIRVAVVLVGFFLLLRADWRYLLAALAGFIVARTLLAYKLKTNGQQSEVKE